MYLPPAKSRIPNFDYHILGVLDLRPRTSLQGDLQFSFENDCLHCGYYILISSARIRYFKVALNSSWAWVGLYVAHYVPRLASPAYLAEATWGSVTGSTVFSIMISF